MIQHEQTTKNATYIGIFSSKQYRLIELTHNAGCIYDSTELLVSVCVLLVCPGRAVVIRGQEWSYSRNSAQEEHSVEVDILEPFRVRCDTRDETLKIGALRRLS